MQTMKYRTDKSGFHSPGYINRYHFLGKFCTLQIRDAFLNFPPPPKKNLAFHANCLHCRQSELNVKNCLLGKIKKNISVC